LEDKRSIYIHTRYICTKAKHYTMSFFYSPSNTFVLIFCVHFLVVAHIAGATNFYNDFVITWGGGRGRISRAGDVLTLSLDRVSGSGFQSKKTYLFGRIDMQLKLVPGNSAGTVTAYYLSSLGANRDEIDFEFLGNTTGEPYTLHTNVYAQGKGEREQQFRMWFNPTLDFHTYSIVWTPRIIIFLVDNTPIREFKNREAFGVPFPKKQPMRLYSSLWNADEWATRGGLVKTDWSRAPFMASYRNFKVRARGLSQSSMTHRQKLRWVRRNHMIYNYCTDAKRFPRVSGSGFQSKKAYLFGRIDMQLKLVPGNSAGTVTAYYNREAFGIPFPKNQPMRLYSSLWNADEWATRGGLVKTDWSRAPFMASYRNFNVRAGGLSQSNMTHRQKLRWVRRNHMIYNYCTDAKRFPRGFPAECKLRFRG
ncbi:hypothetical protein M8C21_023128, partial [Ambrosia artemisiifolia]